MDDSVPAFTPVTLVTGFLGSGKTTLLQRLLADPALTDTAVLINEFGEIGLDHHLLERIDAQTVLLQSGCLCCTIRGELAAAMRDLQARRARGLVPPFRRLAIETTGLADPLPILTTLHAEPVLQHHFRPGNIITTVDAVNGRAQLAKHAESRKQLAIADRIVLTKTDLAAPAEIALLLARIAEINPAAPILRAAEERLDVQLLLARDAFDPALDDGARRRWFGMDLDDPGHAQHDRNRHGADIRAFALTFAQPLDWTMFGVWLSMLLNRHGERVLRVKGILAVAGETAPVAVHGVQHLVHPPVHMRAWPDADRRSRIVFIVDGLDPAAIERSLLIFMGHAKTACDASGKTSPSSFPT
jgi:G3E family GTPase